MTPFIYKSPRTSRAQTSNENIMDDDMSGGVVVFHRHRSDEESAQIQNHSSDTYYQGLGNLW